jgi:hypothetical protein
MAAADRAPRLRPAHGTMMIAVAPHCEVPMAIRPPSRALRAARSPGARTRAAAKDRDRPAHRPAVARRAGAGVDA